MQELWNTTLVVWINLWLCGWILSTCGKYITLWKPNLMHYCPTFYAGSRVAWLVSHGRRRSPGYCCVIPWLCATSILQWVVLIAGSFSVKRRVILPTTFVSMPGKPSSQASVVWWFLQYSCSILSSSLLCAVLRVVVFPTAPFIGDSACKSIPHTPSDR